jgi:nucleoside-diphosphate-sugar epimerase
VKALVTGGSGFVGLNIVEALLARGDSVVVAAEAELPAFARSALERLPGALETVRLDVSDDAAVHAACAEYRPDTIVHAAVITAGEERELTAFDRVVDVNVKGAGHVLAAALRHGVRRTVYVSSGSAYGAALYDRDIVNETTPPEPDSLYAITKYAAERLCARFRAAHGLEVVSVRLGSVFGPWERVSGVRDTLSLPFQIFKRAAEGEEVVLPQREARRDWVYGTDVGSSVLALLDASALRHGVYNVSAGAQWPGFAKRWCETLRRVFPEFRYRLAAEGEAANVSFLGERDRALMSIERLTSATGYRARYTDSDVFTHYAKWLEACRGYYD